MEKEEYEHLKKKVVEYIKDKKDTGVDEISAKDFYLFAGLNEDQIGDHGYYNGFLWGALLLSAGYEL